MSNIWYYAEDESERGPMTLAELASTLSRMSQPAAVLVWRPGFPAWQRADAIKEVAQLIFKPPPLRVKPPEDGRTKTTISAPRLQPQAEIPDLGPANVDVSNPNGIEGWLILLAIGQGLGLLRFFVSLGQYYAALDTSLIRRIPVTFFGEALMNICLAVLFVYTTSLFFRTSRRFPRFFIYQTVAGLLSVPASAIWAATTISVVTGQSLDDLMQRALGPREVGQTIAIGIIGTVWILYLSKSRRAANTFVD